ncbi:MAG: insulinase family protein, partial [Myxococcales bacterium]|nr:insulinase family protein [Myxococcales bacterium]
EHLMFQKTENHEGEYFEPFEKIGGSVNGTTNTDRTNYFERVPKQYLELALWMESDRMESLLDALTQDKLDNQRDVVKNERRQRYENSPYGMVWKYLHEHLYPVGHPYQHTTIGSHEDLTAASLDDVKAFFRQYYVPKNAILTIVGDFERDQALALAKKYFGHLPPGERAPMPALPLPEQKAKHIVEKDEVKLARIHLAWHTPAFFAEGDAAMDVLASVLSSGKTSRLYKPLVYDKKVAKDVNAFQLSRALGSTFVVQATVAPGSTIDELARELVAALHTALATPPTEDEMTRAVNGWRKSFYGRVEGVIERAQMISTYFHHTGHADYIGKDLERYTSLSAADVAAAGKRYLVLDRPLRIDILPETSP